MTGKKITAISSALCVAVLAAIGAWFLAEQMGQNSLPEADQPVQAQTQPQEAAPDPAERPETEETEGEQQPANQPAAGAPTENKGAAAEQTAAPGGEKDVFSLTEKEISRIEWCRPFEENGQNTTEITLVTEEGDKKALLAELNSFAQEGEWERGEWEKINPSMPARSFGQRNGLYLYGTEGQLLYSLYLEETPTGSRFSVRKGPGGVQGNQYSSSRSLKVLEGILQGIYDKWAQKYAMFYLQPEDIREVLLLNNSSRESVVLHKGSEVKEFSRALRQLILQKPAAKPQGLTAPAGTCDEVRVYLKNGSKCVYHLYREGIASAAGEADVDLLEKGFYKSSDPTYRQLLSLCENAMDTREHYISWLTMIEPKNVFSVTLQDRQTAQAIKRPQGSQEGQKVITLCKQLTVPREGSKALTDLEEEDWRFQVTIELEYVTYEVYLSEKHLAIAAQGYQGALYQPENIKESGLYAALEQLAACPAEEKSSPEPAPENPEKADPPMAKPVIYLYPQQAQQVNIKLELDGELTYTYPTYTEEAGWNVLAQPDGTLTDLRDGSTHYYLFWEGVSSTPWQVEEGSVVAGKDTEAFLKNALQEMGLTPKEYNDFLVYWVPKMQNNPYNLISFSKEQYEETVRLTITPTPDSLCRVFMLYLPLQSPAGYEQLPKQQFETFQRTGFAAVEWGGKELAAGALE